MFDTLIIGSGVAAAALAQRLLDKNPSASILILEAGERVKTKDFGLWEQYMVSGRLPYEYCRDLEYPQRDTVGENASVGMTQMQLLGARLFVYGGSTLHWGGWSFRLKPEDFSLKSNVGRGGDWPFGYGTLEDYYCQAEHYLAVSGDSSDKTVPRNTHYPFDPFPFTLQDQPLIESFDKLGIGYCNVPIARRGVSTVPSRHAPCQTTGNCKYCPFGARYVAGDYLDDIREWNDYPNFEIKLGAIVESIEFSEKKKATGVTYTERATGKPITVGANRIVVAAGTFESAKLLMRSTSSFWPKGVGNDACMVGHYIITHPYFIYTGTRAKNPLRLQPEMDFPTLASRHFDTPKEQPDGKFMLVNPPDTVPVQLAAKMQAGFTRSELETYLDGELPVQIHGMVEVFGDYENSIANLPRRNHLGLLQTSVDYSADRGFKNRMAQIKSQLQKIYEAMDAKLTDDASVSWRADHAASTCRMSLDPSHGVVDKDLHVHGTDNLFVCSNAVFPSIGAINPTLTLTALAFRLGDHLNGAEL
jgi:choline dehydrogenase-like flavoprotein